MGDVSRLTEYLTPFYLERGILVFLGLGFTMYLGGRYVVPFLRNRAAIENPTFDLGEYKDVWTFFHSRLAIFFFKYVLAKPKIRRMLKHPSAFLIYLIPYSVAFITILGLTLSLLTSVGLKSPLTWQGLYYDLIFSRSNGQANGSHIVSYLGVVIVIWAMAIKYRDGKLPNLFIGGMAGAMAGGIHEAPWVIAYYLRYAQYLNAGVTPNIILDWTSFAMYILFIAAYWKTPMPKVPLSAFKIPIIVSLLFLAAWFIVPDFFGFGFFPVTTVNNPSYGQTIYNETQWWGNPVVEGLEGLSWDFLCVMFLVVILRHKR